MDVFPSALRVLRLRDFHLPFQCCVRRVILLSRLKLLAMDDSHVFNNFLLLDDLVPQSFEFCCERQVVFLYGFGRL